MWLPVPIGFIVVPPDLSTRERPEDLAASRASATFWLAMSLGTLAMWVLVLGQVRFGSPVRFDGAGRFVVIANVLVAATAFIRCPRRHLRRKGVTLFCLLPAAALFVEAMLEWLLITWPRQFLTVSQLLNLV